MSSLSQVLQAAVGPAFQIEKELPGAGMSRVFLAREPALDRTVVIKVLPPDLISNASLQRFTREIQVTARLQHPYILPVITAGGTGELRYYVAPFIRGESLRAKLSAGTVMPFAEAIRIGDQLLQAVAFAHERGVIHRDIKPGNVLLSEGHVILADFGIAGLADEALEHVDGSGSTLDAGRMYLAPERPRDESRDLYATAVLIHELVTGTTPEAGKTTAAIGGEIRARHPTAPAADVRKLSAILGRALSLNPPSRYSTAAEMRSAIHSIGHASRKPIVIGAGIAAAAALVILAVRPAPAPQTILLNHPLGDSAQPVKLQHESKPADPVVSPTIAKADAPKDSAEPEGRAQLRRAIEAAMLNSPADNEAARAAATRAIADSASFDGHDRAIARGYLALAERRFPAACAAFDEARAARPSFEAWFGLGECRQRDDVIVIDSAGAPSFRSGYDAAFNAYSNATRATTNAPAVVYRRLMSVVPQNAGDARLGRSADNRTFIGHWRPAGDTLGFTIVQSGVLRPGAPETMNEAADAARIGRERLRPLLLAWVRKSPGEASAHEMLSLLLENMGAVAQSGDDKISALSEMERARALENDSVNALRLAIAHTRLLLRAKHHDALGMLADSLLRTHPNPSAAEAEPLMPLALLTGRISLATKLLTQVSATSNRVLRGVDGRPVDLPPAAIAERADFVVRASLGVCDDRVKSAPKRMVEQLDAAFPSGVPRGVESAFMERSVLLALPCVGPSVMKTMREPGRLLQSWAPAYDLLDTSFPAQFAARSRGRQLAATSDPGMDAVIVEALARLSMKDSAGALQSLTLGLDRVPFITRGVFTNEWVIGSTVRGMATAAKVADALGERDTARRWATAAVALWKNADPELQPEVQRLRAIAVRSGDPPPE